jgi:peptidoglycan/LPS O-acetylase OafA/YrhL
MIPALASVLFAWLIIKIHGFYDLQAAALMGHGPDGPCPIIEDRSFFDALKLGAYSIFFDHNVDLRINAPLWTMPIELQGSFLIYAFLALIGPLTNRPIIYVILAALCFSMNRIALFDFLAGVFICDVFIALEKRKFRVAFPLSMGLPALALGVLLGGLKEVWVMNLIHLIVPRHEEGARQGIQQAIAAMPTHHTLPLTELGVMSIPASFFIIASVMFCPALQAAFHAKIFLFLGRISFPLYLFHMPVIHSLGCFTYTRLYALHQTHLSSTLGASFVSIVASVFLAWAAYHAVDLPSIRFGRVFDEWIRSVTMPWHNWTARGAEKS